MIDSTQDTHIQLVLALQEGDESAFVAFYDSYAALLFGIIVRIVQDREESENLLQDCFIKIWRNIGQYDPEKGRVATWLINIARNTALDFKRSRYFNQKLKNQNVENFVGQEKDNTVITPVIETVGLRELLQKLPPHCREVIEWLYFEGYTQQEVSDKLNMPLGTVKSRTRLALKELRSFYY